MNGSDEDQLACLLTVYKTDNQMLSESINYTSTLVKNILRISIKLSALRNIPIFRRVLIFTRTTRKAFSSNNIFDRCIELSQYEAIANDETPCLPPRLQPLHVFVPGYDSECSDQCILSV